MTLFFQSVPYFLAVGTFALGAFEIIRNWKEYGGSRLRIAVSIVFMVVAALSIASLYHDNDEKNLQKIKSDGDMKALQSKVDAANQTQGDNTKLFLDSFNKMSAQVSDLKVDVKTEALQKKLASVQNDLLNTQKALAPGPKAELAFSFVPFDNPPPPGITRPTREVTVSIKKDGSIHLEFTVINLTNTDAIEVDADVFICEDCKFSNEPIGLSKLPGSRENMRFLSLNHLHALEAYQSIGLDISPPPGASKTQIGVEYRCRTCAVHRGIPGEMMGEIHIARP